MRNLFKQFRDLIPEAPLQAGTVTTVVGGVATVAPGRARNEKGAMDVEPRPLRR